MSLRVVVSGIFYPVAMMQYFINALERRDDVELFKVGPHTGNWIPWGGGMYLHPKYDKPPDFALPYHALNQSIPFSFVKPHLPWKEQKPDLWLQIDAGFHFSDRPEAEVVALIETDPHVLKKRYECPKGYSDFTFCMQTPYLHSGEHYLPYAYDPDIHYPIDNVNKNFDACLIGLQYQQRDLLVQRLRYKGLNIYYNLGDVYDEYRNLVNKSKVGLNWSSLLDMNARVWELAAMRVCSVQNTVPDMPTFFVEGDHYLGFSNIDEAVSQVMYAIENSDEREEIANAAYRKVTAGNHTYDSRIQQVLEICGLK